MFVLDLDHDRHALPAMMTYAYAVAKEQPQLAADITRMVDERMKR